MSEHDPAKALRLAIAGRWIEHLFDVESKAALRRERAAKSWDNGPDEGNRLARLSRSWRARTLVWLRIDAGGRGDQHLDLVAKRQWERDVG